MHAGPAGFATVHVTAAAAWHAAYAAAPIGYVGAHVIAAAPKRDVFSYQPLSLFSETAGVAVMTKAISNRDMAISATFTGFETKTGRAPTNWVNKVGSTKLAGI